MINDNKPHDYCGIFGIYSPHNEISRLTFYGLLALQHRGQESAGIAAADGKKISIHKGMGLVTQIFTEAIIKKLKGNFAIGHTRYSTEGSSNLINSQPILLDSMYGNFALAHNGNLSNFKHLKNYLLNKGHAFNADVDSEVIIRLILHSKGKNIKEKMITGIKEIQGAFSLVFLTKNKLYAVRDQWGIRPLVFGKTPENAYIVASESVAIESLGGKVIREVLPGEFLEIDQHGIKSFHQIINSQGGFCIFEYVYFSRPDSVIDKKLVYQTRVKAGINLAKEHPIKADLVMSVPDSGTPAAVGYSQESGIPYETGLIKSRYVGRTFIEPSQSIRQLGVKLKFSPLRKILKNKSIILVDDSIVRGTTIKEMIKMLREAGVKKIHLRIASPPFKHICYLGVDVNRYSELIASKLSVEEISSQVGADSLGYLSLTGLKKSVGRMKQGFCTGCFNGKYPVDYDSCQLNKQKKKIAVMISNTGSGSNLQALIDACDIGKINGKIMVVVSNNDCAYGLERAKKSRIEILIKSFNSFSNHHAYHLYAKNLAIELMKKYSIDVVVLAGWEPILPKSFLNLFPYKVIELRPTICSDSKNKPIKLSDGSISQNFNNLLGSKIIEATIKARISISGVSTYFQTDEKTYGPVIMRFEEKIKEHDTPESLYIRIKQKEHQVLPLTVKLFCENKIIINKNGVKILSPKYKNYYTINEKIDF